mgnify:CR=1 FL=1|jgi:plasmid stabilization system protein ParE
MALAIEWTNEARYHLDQTIEYLELNWTEKELVNFFTKLEQALSTISEHPEQHKLSLRKPNTREYQITEHTTLFYSFDDKVVTVLLLWPNRMNPKNL